MGVKVRQMQAAGQEVPAELQAGFDQAEEKLFVNVRNLFGGNIRQCNTGAAPIAKEILEFFYACGVPVMEGYGMTETATVATVNTPDEFRLGSVGKPIPGVEAKIAEDGEVLLRGANIFKGYYKNEDATGETLVDGWLHTGDLGSIDEDGFLFITGRKKDIIITAGGKNITPANLENGLKQSRWISQAVVVGDRRPYLVALITIDPDEIAAFAGEHGIEESEVTGSDADARRGPGGGRQGQRHRRPRRADQEVHDPAAGPDPGDRRADPDAEGQAQRGQREERRRDRQSLRLVAPGR